MDWRQIGNTLIYESNRNNSGVLPDGWKIYTDNTGDIWYADPTRQTTWNRPPINNPKPSSSIPGMSIPNVIKLSNEMGSIKKQRNNAIKQQEINKEMQQNINMKAELNSANISTLPARKLFAAKLIQNAQTAENVHNQAQLDYETANKDYNEIYNKLKKIFSSINPSRSRSVFHKKSELNSALSPTKTKRNSTKKALNAAKQNANSKKRRVSAIQKIISAKEAALSKFSGYATQTTAKEHTPVGVMTEEELKRLRGWRPIINLKP